MVSRAELPHLTIAHKKLTPELKGLIPDGIVFAVHGNEIGSQARACD